MPIKQWARAIIERLNQQGLENDIDYLRQRINACSQHIDELQVMRQQMQFELRWLHGRQQRAVRMDALPVSVIEPTLQRQIGSL